ncbi:hypothetical protein Prudu_009798 [Prunus dulcis]|uniref:Transposable element protein n=1 Tax=Prunus dulcis TaxID=3755 RepID=A0A4Y1R6W3_PRUDU|nr:hypothetical protein Prudu_009798 [Prunus dulcis]
MMGESTQRKNCPNVLLANRKWITWVIPFLRKGSPLTPAKFNPLSLDLFRGFLGLAGYYRTFFAIAACSQNPLQICSNMAILLGPPSPPWLSITLRMRSPPFWCLHSRILQSLLWLKRMLRVVALGRSQST